MKKRVQKECVKQFHKRGEEIQVQIMKNKTAKESQELSVAIMQGMSEKIHRLEEKNRIEKEAEKYSQDKVNNLEQDARDKKIFGLPIYQATYYVLNSSSYQCYNLIQMNVKD